MNFEEVMNIAKDLVVLYKDIDYYDVIDPINDINNIEGEFIEAAYENLINKDTRSDITVQLEELKMDIDDPGIKLKISNMLDRIETLFQTREFNQFENIKNTGIYNVHQLHEIEKGIKNGIDIRYYAADHFNEGQMYQIRKLLEYQKEYNLENIDISLITNNHLSYGQMGEIRRSFEAGLETEQITVIANPDIPRMNMSQLREMFLDGASIADVTNFTLPHFSFQHLWITREIFKEVKDKSLIPENIFNWNSSLEELLEIKNQILEPKKSLKSRIEKIRNSSQEKIVQEKSQTIDR